MIKFDLEKALAGKKVITRDGREVTELHLFKGNANNTFFGVCNGSVLSWVNSGRAIDNIINSNLDLFMVIELIDGKAYQFEDRRNKVKCGIYNKERGVFSVEQGQYFDDISVTNIQPLTLEVQS